jgi:hypothetical protein
LAMTIAWIILIALAIVVAAAIAFFFSWCYF